jgi:hypothetical protein
MEQFILPSIWWFLDIFEVIQISLNNIFINLVHLEQVTTFLNLLFETLKHGDFYYSTISETKTHISLNKLIPSMVTKNFDLKEFFTILRSTSRGYESPCIFRKVVLLFGGNVGRFFIWFYNECKWWMLERKPENIFQERLYIQIYNPYVQL